MRHLIILLALAGCATAPEPVMFKNASVGAAATNPDYWGTPVQVCGHVTRLKGPQGEWILGGAGFSANHGLLVDALAGPLQQGAEACVRGVVRQRDGLAGDEFRHIEDAINPDLVLYPCSDAANCREAAVKKMPK